jgi:molecular chaperone HscB
MWLWREFYSVTQDYFALFGLSAAFNIDLATLEKNFRQLQSESHPDRFVNASATTQLQAMQRATLANEAYQTLKNHSRRAQYLLSQQGIDAIAETNTAMPMDFLMQQMEWREAIDDAKNAQDVEALEQLLTTMRQSAHAFHGELATLLDVKHDYHAATDITRKLIFIDKVCADILQMIEQLEN